MRVRDLGIYNGTLKGFNSSSNIDGVLFEGVFILENMTSAKTLEDMKNVECGLR
jgi:hypothetical protein